MITKVNKKETEINDLSENRNFRNNQNYILWMKEKKRVNKLLEWSYWKTNIFLGIWSSLLFIPAFIPIYLFFWDWRTIGNFLLLLSIYILIFLYLYIKLSTLQFSNKYQIYKKIIVNNDKKLFNLAVSDAMSSMSKYELKPYYISYDINWNIIEDDIKININKKKNENLVFKIEETESGHKIIY